MEKIIIFLKENLVTTLATSFNNMPRASVMEYGIVGDAIIFATSPHSIKARNLESNPRISMSVYNMPEFVTIDGVVEEPTGEEISGYNVILFERHPDFKEMEEEGKLEPFKYFKIKPETIYYNDYSEGNPTEIIKL